LQSGIVITQIWIARTNIDVRTGRVGSPRSSQRAELTRLREAMVKRGGSIDETASEVRARFKYGVRAAYRHAAGLTLDQTA
jgi:hypothetical protein